MKLLRSFRFYFVSMQIVIVLLFLYSGYLAFQVYQVTAQIATREQGRFDMVALAAELQQSSEQMTRLARHYAVTGAPHFKQQYETLLAVRRGEAPRPKGYFATYWEIEPQQPGKETASLESLIQTKPYNQEERQLLLTAVANADKLVLIQRQAFSMVEAAASGPSLGGFSNQGVSNLNRAQSLLFGDRFQTAQDAVMSPIDDAMRKLNQRTSQELGTLHEREEELATSIPYILVINFVLILVLLGLTNWRFHRYHQELIDLSLRDHLTRLHNRKYLGQFGQTAMLYHQRYNNPVCLALMDIDHFKKINDTYGHDAGDQILVHFAQSLSKRIRKTDTLVRYGGEEFVLIMPNIEKAQCQAYMEELCEYVASQDYQFESHNIVYTVSIGWASDIGSYHMEHMLTRADLAMYQSKQGGRNRATPAEE
ncbi:MAG: GGDEF domain-containing protein, partial [Cellvibrionaceae bacterium]|nr:GGDEF domain-containing protein [Cellvibrionaceae bacterium]